MEWRRTSMEEDDEEPREAGEEREEEELAPAVRFSQLPEDEQRILKGLAEQGRRRKKQVWVELSRDVVEKMQATGEGWERRIEEAARLWLAREAAKRRRAAS